MQLVPFYRQAFLRQQPRRYAVMQPPGSAKKYDDHHGQLTDQQIALLLAGKVAFAVPYAENGLAHLLAFDVDCDHLADPYAPIRALLDEATRRGLFAFGQYDPQRRRGYVWIPFDDLVNAERVRALGDQLIAMVSRTGWSIENRATNEDTRLPLCCHAWTGIYGMLVLDGQQLDIDSDPAGAFAQLASAYRENPTDWLPTPPPAEAKPASRRSSSANGKSITIDRFNAEHDLIDLLISYNARPVGRRMFLCPFHDDQHASLALWRNRDGKLVCHCKSQHSNCPLAARPGCDAFYIYCVGESLTEQEAIRRLNGRDDDPPPQTGPQTPPAAPGRAAPTQTLPQTRSAVQKPAQRARATSESSEATRTAIILSMAMDSRLKDSDRAILRAILQSSPTLEAYQSVNDYAQQAGYSERATRYALRDLERHGYLLRIRDRGREGETNVYRLIVPQQEGGQNPAPTWNLKIPTQIIPDVASRGGQGETKPASDQTAPGPDAGASVPSSDPAELVAPVLVEQPVSVPGHELAIDAGDVVRGPGGAVLFVGGAAYVPAGAEAWYEAMQQAAARNQAEQDRLVVDQAEPMQHQLPAAPADPPQAEPQRQPTRRHKKRSHSKCVQPGELVSRIIAAERKAEKVARSNPRQAAAIRRNVADLQRRLAALRAELDAQAGDPPSPRPTSADRGGMSEHVGTFGHAQPAGKAMDERVPLPPPTCSLVPELPADGWCCEAIGGSWRAVHNAGYVTHCYVNPEAARRAIDRREYTPLTGG